MICKFDKKLFIFIYSLATALLVVQSSESTPIENGLLETLRMRLDGMQEKVNLLEAKNTNNEVEIHLLEAKNVKKEEKIDLLGEKYLKKVDEIVKLKAEINSKPENRHFPVSTNNGKLNNDNKTYSDDPSTRAAGPSSCNDLSLIGYILDGLYLVQNRVTKKIETVLCDFGTTSQQLIGNVEVKTKNIHFYVQRKSYYVLPSGIIEYELELLNEGGAMDSGSGIFTAPVDGIYHFEFAAVKDGVSSFLEIVFYAGGRDIGYLYNADGSADGMFLGVSLTASLRLKTNDQVYFLNVFGGRIIGGTTHFTGWLVEEDLV